MLPICGSSHQTAHPSGSTTGLFELACAIEQSAPMLGAQWQSETSNVRFAPFGRSSMTRRMTTTVALTAFAMFAFAANSILCRLALAHTTIDPATFTLVRLVSGAVVLSLLAFSQGRRAVAGSWPAAMALLVYAAGFSFAYVSLPAATGALLLFGAVQATMIISGLVSGERLTVLQWSGLSLAVIGLTMLLAPGVTAPEPTGAMLMATAGIAWGIYSLLGRGGADPLATTAGNFGRAAALAIPLLVLMASRWDKAGLFLAAVSGAVASGIGYAVWYAALPGLTATRAASVQLSVPVITALSGVLLLSEPVSTRLLLTSMAVLSGIALVVWAREPVSSPAK